MRERQMIRVAAALNGLDRYAETQCFQGPGSYYAWERLTTLVGRLRCLFDAFELEGDAEPLRLEVETFRQDLGHFQVKPDRGVETKLRALLDGLELDAGPELEIFVSTVPMATSAAWSDKLLAVRPDTLAAMLGERAVPQGPPPAA